MPAASFVMLLLSAAALADDLDVLVDADGAPVWLLEPIPGHWTERTGFGTPTVVYDDRRGDFVMYFESRIYDEWLFNGPDDTPAGLGLNPRDYDDCRLGRDPANPAIVWAIGRASSTDGFEWVVDQWPVLLPEPGTFYACQVAQPSAIRDGRYSWHLYFKAVQWNPNTTSPDRVEPCADGEAPDWGCTRTTGFGHASSRDGRDFRDEDLVLPARDVTAATGVPANNIGFPRVSVLNHDWYLWYTAVPEVYQAVARRAGDTFVSERTPIAQYPPDDAERVTTGAVFCREGVPPVAMLSGLQGLTRGECGLSVVASPNLDQWFRSDNELLTWDCAAGWDRWETLDAPGRLVVWYAARESPESTAPRRIGFAATFPLPTEPPYPRIDGEEYGNKSCKRAPVKATPLVGWSQDLGPLPNPMIAEPPSAGGGGCGCGGGPPIGAAALPLLLLAARRRPTASRRSGG